MAGRAPHGDFPEAAKVGLADSQQRRNLRKATTTIRAKREAVVAEVDDWEDLRDRGKAIKEHAMRHLDEHLERLEERVTAAGGTVHWARDAAEATDIVARLTIDAGADEVVKVKSMATDEIALNDGLAQRGIAAVETDLAELIVQLGDDDRQSHILVPAIHRNREEIRALFREKLPGNEDLSADPAALTAAARAYLRRKFLSAEVGVSGANFAIAETGSVGVVESEGNGRMCTTLPPTLITVMGIEKVLPRFEDLSVFLQLLPRSSTAERMNPYTSIWTGTADGDGPRDFHLVLLDAGRTATLADHTGRQALHCIKCSACLNVCPVYERAGGLAYESTYPGPIGAILSPQLSGPGAHDSLPWASSLCGACYEVCPVKIDIPSVLIHLRTTVNDAGGGSAAERRAMQVVGRVFASRRRYEAAQKAARAGARPFSRDGKVEARLPGPLRPWLEHRDLPAPPAQTFREWWAQERSAGAGRTSTARGSRGRA